VAAPVLIWVSTVVAAAASAAVCVIVSPIVKAVPVAQLYTGADIIVPSVAAAVSAPAVAAVPQAVDADWAV